MSLADLEDSERDQEDAWMIIIPADVGQEETEREDARALLCLALSADGSPTGEALMLLFASFGKISPCL